MSHSPLVSVIIPFFNAQRFIGEAIDSVFAQTYDDWELILVDDGSSDRSGEIAHRYAEDHSEKVIYLDHEGHANRGACASRNVAIRHARGEYIALLDADDVWLPRKLEQQITVLTSQPEAAMVYGATQYWYSWTGEPQATERDYVRPLGVPSNQLFEPPTLLILALESKAPTPGPSNILLRRRTMEQVGGFEENFNGMYQLYEDQAFLAKVYLNAPVFVSLECWDRYRQHPESCVAAAKTSGTKHRVGLFYFKWLERYLLARGIDDPGLWKALRRKRMRYRHPTLYRWLENLHNRQRQIKQRIGPAGQRAIASQLLRWFRPQ
jgi:glycosyltransferase involved in cell wall biosynthesis